MKFLPGKILSEEIKLQSEILGELKLDQQSELGLRVISKDNPDQTL